MLFVPAVNVVGMLSMPPGVIDVAVASCWSFGTECCQWYPSFTTLNCCWPHCRNSNCVYFNSCHHLNVFPSNWIMFLDSNDADLNGNYIRCHLTFSYCASLTACRPASKLCNPSFLSHGTRFEPYNVKISLYKRRQPTARWQGQMSRNLVALRRLTACMMTSACRNKIIISIASICLSTSCNLFWKYVINTKQHGRKPTRQAQYIAPVLRRSELSDTALKMEQLVTFYGFWNIQRWRR